MAFKLNLTLLAGLLGLALLLLGTSCDGTEGGGGSVTSTKRPTLSGDGNAPMADGTAPGIDFTKTTIGLPARTLDFISSRPVALAGASAGGRVFFGIKEGTVTRLYSRNLADCQRTYLADVDRLVQGSLAVDSEGTALVYSRRRSTDNYIDDPYYKFPSEISIVYRMDAATGESTELFDFRDSPWRAYRGDGHMPYITPDGSKVYSLAYNLDWLHLDSQLKEWLAIDADFTERFDELTAEEQEEGIMTLRTLLVSRHVKPLLEGIGVEVLEEGAVTEAERQGVIDLERETGVPEMALMVWEGGESKLLQLKPAQSKRQTFHFIMAANNDTVLMVAPEQFADQAAPQPIYRVDLVTGELAEIASYTGVPSNYLLDNTGENLILVYNPIDAEAREVMTETRVQVTPLAGGETRHYELPGDYVGLSAISGDGKSFVGQDKDDMDLYKVDVETGERQLLRKLLAEVESMFIEDSGRHAVYSDNGVLFQIDIPADPQQDPSWVSEDHLAEHLPKIKEFFTTAGFTLPADLIVEWEDRQGLGEHELAVELRNPAEPDKIALLRYQVEEQRVVSVWFPANYPFPIDEELTGTELDFYAIEELALKVQDRLGWLSPETRTLYQPGPNPLYDAHTDSFIVAYRDGYWYGEGDNAQWVFGEETTMRVRAADGMIMEMTISQLGQVLDQEITLPLDQTKMIIRNHEKRPFPDSANVRFDLENYRLVLHQRRLDHWGENGYEAVLMPRICYEIDTYILPEDSLILTTRIDATSGDILGEIEFMPTNIDY